MCLCSCAELTTATYRIDGDNLNTLGRVMFSDGLPGFSTTAHPKVLADGTIVNFTSPFPFGGCAACQWARNIVSSVCAIIVCSVLLGNFVQSSAPRPIARPWRTAPPSPARRPSQSAGLGRHLMHLDIVVVYAIVLCFDLVNVLCSTPRRMVS
jgi:hypothetical protein